jgi:WD40 repeat protein
VCVKLCPIISHTPTFHIISSFAGIIESLAAEEEVSRSSAFSMMEKKRKITSSSVASTPSKQQPNDPVTVPANPMLPCDSGVFALTLSREDVNGSVRINVWEATKKSLLWSTESPSLFPNVTFSAVGDRLIYYAGEEADKALNKQGRGCIAGWNLETGKHLFTLKDSLFDVPTQVVLSNSAKRFVTFPETHRNLAIWDTDSGSKLTHVSSTAVFAACFTPDDSGIICLDYNGCMYVLNAKTGYKKSYWETDLNGMESVMVGIHNHLVVSARQSSKLCAAMVLKRIVIRNFATGKHVMKCDCFEGTFGGACFGYDDLSLITIGSNMELSVFNIADIQTQLKIVGSFCPFVVSSPNTNTIYVSRRSADSDQPKVGGQYVVCEIDVVTGVELSTSPGYDNYYPKLSCSGVVTVVL